MSIKKYFYILSLIVINGCYSQEKQTDTVVLFLNLKSKTITYSISKDTTSASFGIYRKGFETKKSRDNAMKPYLYRGKNTIKNFEDLKKANPKDMPKSDMLPTFSLNYWSIKMPEYLKSVNGINYITEEEFRAKELNYLSKKIYMIHKLDNGLYLKWDVIPTPEE
ncbi:hypothetical protein [Flavobacterium sp. A45]|uniref:hypothetical protein n=1 Tax=Flavobacterium sp. A45 TaxID=1945862 RepID=UPI00098706BE|nr:hypothetical protein [Flavobacterium sp. A45]OOG63826.1 hypothetical protein B0E44_17605 [Flavobacterium sp. A45]